MISNVLRARVEAGCGIRSEEAMMLLAEVKRLEIALAEAERKWRDEKQKNLPTVALSPFVIYNGRKYQVLHECRSVNNGTKEYVIRNGEDVLVVLASECGKKQAEELQRLKST